MYKPSFLTFGKAARVVRRSGAGAAAVSHVADVQRIEPRRRHRAGHGLHADAERTRWFVHQLHQAGQARCIPSARRSWKAASTSASGVRRPISARRGTSSRTSRRHSRTPIRAVERLLERGEERAACSRTRGTELSLNLRPITSTNYSWDIGARLGTKPVERRELSGAQFLLTDNVLAADGRAGRVTRSACFAATGWVRCGMSADNAIRRRRPRQPACNGKHARGRSISTTARTTAAPSRACRARIRRQRIDRQSESEMDRQRALELPLQEVEVSRASSTSRRAARCGTERRARCTATARTRTPRVARPARRRRRRAHVHGQRTRDRRVGLLSGHVFRPGRRREVPGRRELVSNERARRLSVHRLRRSVHRGRRLREAARDLGRLHVRSAVGRADARHDAASRCASRAAISRRGRRYTGLDPETSVGGASSRVGGTDYFNLPLTRSFVVTVSLNR